MNKLNIMTLFHNLTSFFKMFVNVYSSNAFAFVFDFTNNVVNVSEIVIHFEYANFYFRSLLIILSTSLNI